MSDHLPLDKHIKEQLGHYSPDVPPHIWDQIVARREQQRPKGFWLSFSASRKWLLMAALLLGLGGTAAQQAFISNTHQHKRHWATCYYARAGQQPTRFGQRT
jgi:hypothetical protein